MLWGGVLCKTVKPLKAVFFNALLFSFLLLSTAFISCAGGAGSPKGSDSGETSLSVRLPGSKALYDKDDIVTFTVTISSGSYSNTKTAGKGETMTFSNIPAGTYSVTAYGKVADGSVAAKCVTSVQIIAGENTSTTIRLQRLDYYVVTFRNEDGSVISQQNVTTGYTVSKPADPTKEGYNFSGWRTSPTATSSFDFNTPITADTTLHAKFGIKTYKITFNYNGGTVGTATSTTVDADYNTSPTVPTTAPTRTAPDGSAYTFMNGWNESPDATTILAGLDPATADKTYYAVWAPKVKVTFDFNGGTNAGSTKKEVYPNKDTAPEVPASTEEPSKSGYKFMGWASTSNATVADNTVSTTPVSADTTYYAVWLPAYTITYSSTPTIDTTSAAFSGKLSYTSDEGLASMPEPTVSGLTFDGWYTDTAFTPANKLTSIAPGTTGNVTLYAKWKVTVTFDYNGGKVGSSISSEADYDYASTFSSIKPSTNPTKSHAAFKHWSTVSDGTGTAVSGTSSVTTSTTYYAIWDSTEIIYESPIELNPNFTSNTGLFKDYTPGTAYTLPGPTYTGLTFAGWYYEEDFSGSEVIAIPATATGEQKLYAKWTATVTFDTQGGSSVSSRTVIYNKKVSKPSNPTKSQRAFLGWYTSEDGGTTLASEAYNFNTAVTQNLTLYAKWGLDISGLSSYIASLPEGSKEAPNVLPAISGLTKDNWNQIKTALKANETKFVDLSATTLPSDITDMMYGFQLCKTLVVAPAIPAGVTILEKCFYGCENLTVAPEIPNKVWDMCNAFQGCSSLTTAPEIPSSVTSMKYCFSRCTSLSGEIVVNALITDSAKWADAFEQVPASVIIKVKSESVKTYITKTGDSHTIVVEP